MQITKKTIYEVEDFDLRFEPIEDSISIKEIEKELCPICKTELEHIKIKKEDVFGCPKCKKELERKKAIKEKGFEIRYLTYDNNPENPFEFSEGNGIFYHWKERGREELEKYCELLGYDPETREQTGKENPDAVRIDKYEHSGITYSVAGEGRNCRWDTSSTWAVWYPDNCLLDELKGLKGKTRRNKCIEYARQACELFNQWCNGEVYCIVKETFNQNKEQIDHDIVGGFFGRDYAEQALKKDI
jgi:uncharacterized protein YbaR (Trm112 family)